MFKLRALNTEIDALSATVLRMVPAMAALWLVALLRGQVLQVLRTVRDRGAALATLGGSIFGPFLGVWLANVAVKHTEAGIAAADEILIPVDLKDEKAVDAIYNVAELAWQMRGDGPKDGIFVVQVKHLKQAPSVDRNMDLVNDNPFPVAKTIVPDRRAVFNFHNDNRLLAYGADSKGGKEASKTYKKLAKEIR